MYSRIHGSAYSIVRLKMRTILTVIALVLSTSALAATPHMSDSQFDAKFRCPESLPSEQAKDQAVRQYVDWARQDHGNWTVTQLATFRFRLLEKHDCEETLKNIRAFQQHLDHSSNAGK